MTVYSLKTGTSPLLISIPHAGTLLPDDVREKLTPEALFLPDTDWHIPELYHFVLGMNATVLAARHSRYVIDCNRPPDDAVLYPGQIKIPLCPLETFDGHKIYRGGQEPDAGEINRRLESYWHPYHRELQNQIKRIKEKHGYVLLYDAHSIRGEAPRLFEGLLPDLNLGTVKGKSCAPGMEESTFRAAEEKGYSAVLNGRFIGGYITRCYGDPAGHVHALQMELSARRYMNEETFEFDVEKADLLRPVLLGVLQSMLDWARGVYTPARTTPTQGFLPNA